MSLSNAALNREAQRLRYVAFQDVFVFGDLEEQFEAIDRWQMEVKSFLAIYGDHLKRIKPGHYKFFIQWTE